MLKKFLLALFFLATSAFSAHQIELAGPKDILIPAGWSSWVTELPQPIAANPFKVVFWNMGGCRIIPITNISIKYQNIPYWSSTDYKDGAYYGDGNDEITAVKVDFYQNQVERQTCLVKVSGYIQ